MNHGKQYFIFYIGTCYSIVSCSPLILIGAHFSSLAINQLDDLSLFKNMMKKRPCSEITAFKNSDPDLNGIYIAMLLTDWLLVEVALLPIGLTQIYFVKNWF